MQVASHPSMRLDLLVPTLRRPRLARALESIAGAEPPLRLQVRVIVINNDAEPELPGLSSVLASIPFPARVLHEPEPGKSAALNRGIVASAADYLGFTDDEQLAPAWFRVAEEALEAGKVDFLGRAVPVPGSRIPDRVPARYPAVLGIAEGGNEPVPTVRALPACSWVGTR